MAEEVLNRLFDGKQVVANTGEDKSRNAVLPLTDFHPPLNPTDIDVVCAAIDASVKNWDGITACVGLADRSSGPLTHGVAARHNLPYSLANWYPAGSIGDIVVDESGGFTGGSGVIFFNGLKKGDRVIYVDDVIRRGKSSTTLIGALQRAGIEVVQAIFVGAIDGRNGCKTLKDKLGIDAIALATVDVTGETTKVVATHPITAKLVSPPAPTINQIKRLTTKEMTAKFEHVLASFTGIKVYRATNSEYPYCNFPLTDFTPLLTPKLVEDMADCMIWLGDFDACNIIVSESDRGGGPLTLEMARRTGLHFTMANWSQSPHTVGVAAAAEVGYSGHGKLFLNGVKKTSKCLVVDDMLSSGGTAEGLFKAIEASGGTVSEAHFASEKVTTGGRARLGGQWPNLKLFSLCFFTAGSDTTKAATPVYGSNETPIQHTSAYDQRVGFVGKCLHRVVLAGIVYIYIVAR